MQHGQLGQSQDGPLGKRDALDGCVHAPDRELQGAVVHPLGHHTDQRGPFLGAAIAQAVHCPEQAEHLMSAEVDLVMAGRRILGRLQRCDENAVTVRPDEAHGAVETASQGIASGAPDPTARQLHPSFSCLRSHSSSTHRYYDRSD